MELDVAKIAGRAIARVVAILIGQREKGIVRYGVPVEDAPLSSAEWIKHAQEEAADFLVYSVRIEETIEHERKQAVAELAAAIANIADATHLNEDIRVAMIREECDKHFYGVRCHTMYAQQSQLEEFNRTGANLLSISRTSVFPFTTALKVIA